MQLKKGQLLAFKSPPFFDKEYVYEVTAAGDRLIRASLHHSPRVKKQWTPEEFAMLMEHRMIRLIESENDALLQAEQKTVADLSAQNCNSAEDLAASEPESESESGRLGSGQFDQFGIQIESE